ncbi:MAG TPA: LacI family DNA-binding transcriptional regulator [Candidatus Methylacidiphilales bacterium]
MTPPAQPRVTLREIAARVGVSHVTVSKALRNHPKVSQKIRAKIQETAREMNYRPDPVLSSLTAYRNAKRPVVISNALAWINHWKVPAALRQIGEFDTYWQGASEAAEQLGYRLEEFVWDPAMSAKRLETILATRNVLGILLPPHGGQPQFPDLDWSRFSVVRFGLSLRRLPFHLVTSNQFRSLYGAVERMAGYGYRRIGFVLARQFDLNLGGSHVGGFLSAQSLLGLSPCLPPLLLDDPADEAKTARAVTAWLRKHRPDAILTAYPALPGLLEKLGVRVPDDVALAGTSLADVPVSAGIDQNSREIGRAAIQTVVSLIHANERGLPAHPRHILVESRWIDGPSLPRRSGQAATGSRAKLRVP